LRHYSFYPLNCYLFAVEIFMPFQYITGANYRKYSMKV
jgi:hypothetical protein